MNRSSTTEQVAWTVRRWAILTIRPSSVGSDARVGIAFLPYRCSSDSVPRQTQANARLLPAVVVRDLAGHQGATTLPRPTWVSCPTPSPNCLPCVDHWRRRCVTPGKALGLNIPRTPRLWQHTGRRRWRFPLTHWPPCSSRNVSPLAVPSTGEHTLGTARNRRPRSPSCSSAWEPLASTVVCSMPHEAAPRKTPPPLL